MASNFPSSLDTFTNPSSTDAMDSVSVPHATQHSDLNDAVEALQAKVGADSSAVASSHDYKIAQLEAQGSSGLVVLSETLFGPTSTAQFTSAFSATYTNYRAILSVTANAGLAFYLRLLVGSTAQTGNMLSIQQGTNLLTATFGVSTRSDQYGLGFEAFPTYPSRFVIDFFSPFATDYTTYDVLGVGGRSNTDSDALRASVRNIATTSIDGFEITTASGNTLTGTMTLYGVRDA